MCRRICKGVGILIGRLAHFVYSKRLFILKYKRYYGCNNGSTEINNFGNDSEDEMWDADDEDDEFYEDDEPLSFT